MTQRSTNFDAVVIGAGIVGAACADALAGNGLHVAIVEEKCVGGGATGAGMGHIVVMDDSPAQLAPTHYSQQLWEQLRPQLPDAVEYEETGTIWVTADDEEMAEVFRKRDVYAEYGLESKVLSRAELLTEEPQLDASLIGGLLVSGDGVLYPPAAAAFLIDRACSVGAVSLQGHAVIKAACEFLYDWKVDSQRLPFQPNSIPSLMGRSSEIPIRPAEIVSMQAQSQEERK